MKQLQKEIERIEKDKNNPAPKMVWFNAWRHDKVEALWAAFALEFLRKISTYRTKAEVLPTWKGNFKLFLLRLNWRENWQEIGRILFLSLFLGGVALALPALFLRVGWKGINEFSNQVICQLPSEDKSKPENSSNPTPAPSPASPTPTATPAQPPSASPAVSPSQSASPVAAPASVPSPSPTSTPSECAVSNGWLNLLLQLAGLGGSITGALALFAKLGKLIGDPKNDLKKYLESPDYEKQVAFIEKFHEDFEKIVSAYVGKGNKVYVFIDDLDRCELTKAAELMQGLNLLMSNDSDDPHLIFLLGMDREKVAAGIALKQKDVLPYLPSSSVVLDTATQDSRASSKGLEYGYAFIEKFVQLPFQVPQPSEENFQDFLEKMSPLSEELEKPLEQNEITLALFWSLDLRSFVQKEPKLARLWWHLEKLEKPSLRELIEDAVARSRKKLENSWKSKTGHFSRRMDFLWNTATLAYLELLLSLNEQHGLKELTSYLDKLDKLQSTSPKTEKSQPSPIPVSGTESKTSIADLLIRREDIKVSITEDSETVRKIVLMVASALDYNPRRIKQFINLFRLRTFIGSNTGLFDEVNTVKAGSSSTEKSITEQSITLEQLGKFTALCLKYPLLRVDLQKNSELLKNLHHYAFPPVRNLLEEKGFTHHSSHHYDDTTQYWGKQPGLAELFRAGCLEQPPNKDCSLETVNVKKLLLVSPSVVRGVDYSRLHGYLRSGQWREADKETRTVVMKVIQLEGSLKPRENFPCQDLQIIDRLWVNYSKTPEYPSGKWGFSIQKQIWQECSSPMNQNSDNWKEFGDRVGWRNNQNWLSYDDLTFDLPNSPAGEFPAAWYDFGSVRPEDAFAFYDFSHAGRGDGK